MNTAYQPATPMGLERIHKRKFGVVKHREVPFRGIFSESSMYILLTPALVSVLRILPATTPAAARVSVRRSR